MDKGNTAQSTDTIKMVNRALDVLDTLRTERNPAGVNAIAKKCGISPSTAFRILKTLAINGWAYQCADDKYIAGEKLAFLFGKENLYIALQEVASIIMEKYTDRYGQAMNLLIREGSHCYIIQQSHSKNLIDYVPPLYSDLPFYASSGGKVLLSELPIGLLDEIISSRELTPLTPNTITDPDRFWDELKKVSRDGYAIDNRESAANVSCIAVPVRDSSGRIIAALSFSGFISIGKEDLLAFREPLMEASKEITLNLYKVTSA